MTHPTSRSTVSTHSSSEQSAAAVLSVHTDCSCSVWFVCSAHPQHISQRLTSTKTRNEMTGSLSRTCLRLDIASLTAPEMPELGARRKRAPLDLSDGSAVDPAVSLEQQGWYHGSISRSDAEKLLYSAREGSYLVRNCDTTPSRHGPCYSIGIKSARGFMHLKVVRDPAGCYVLGLLDKSFSSIPEMVHYYSVNKLPIRGAEHMSLRHPVIYQLL